MTLRYKLRTLLILLAVLPPLLAGCSYVGGYFACSSDYPGFADRFFPSKWHYDTYQPMVRLEEMLTGRDLVAGYKAADAAVLQRGQETSYRSSTLIREFDPNEPAESP